MRANIYICVQYIEHLFAMTETSGTGIAKILARNLSYLRKERGISLTGLAERAGISKSTLSSLESGEGNPTISTLWALADALGVPFGLLVSERGVEDGTAEVTEAGVNVRLIERSEGEPRIEVYLMRLEPECKREATPHHPGVVERIFVINGRILVGPLKSPSLLKAGEIYSFNADQPHVYIALDEPVSVLVHIEYPKDEIYTDHYTVLRPVPRTVEDWEGVDAILRRALEEVTHGIPVFRLKLYGSEPMLSIAAEKIELKLKQLSSIKFKLPVRYFIVKEQDSLSALIFKWSHGMVQLKSSINGNEILKQATDLLKLISIRNPPLKKQELLQTLVKRQSLTLSVLASDVLLHHGQPAVPSSVFSLLKAEDLKIKPHKAETSLFEYRNMYNFFELLRPGYASQCVALAQQLYRFFNGAYVSAVDVGTGPGLHLRMLMELYPELEVLAVDSSPAACAYLRRNIIGLRKIEIVQDDFLNMNTSEKYPVIISVGASHHLNTSLFLQKAYEMLKNKGILIIADEFISPYATAVERNRELIRHHAGYMLAALVKVPETVRNDEIELVERLNRELPLIAYEAERGETDNAVSRVRGLFGWIRKLKVPVQPPHPLLAYYRFLILELEALMAGLDYEAERKTFPEHFLALAEITGFQLEEHLRVYATSGYGNMSGGTHVFVFKKEV